MLSRRLHPFYMWNAPSSLTDMGDTYDFICGECGYSAQVSGGPDAGMIVSVETMTCTDCKELGDVITGWWRADQAEPEAVGKCPNCQSEAVVSWSPDLRPCPKCGSRMEVDPHGTHTLWD